MRIQKSLCLLICVFALPLVASSQTSTSSSKLPVNVTVQGGLVNGSNGVSADVQAIGTVTLKPLVVGLGAGVDYYRLRTIPLFAIVRKDLGKIKKPAFLYGSLGYNLDWLTEKNRNEIMYSTLSGYGGGLYYDMGIGARFSKKSLTGLIISAGYSRKVMRQNIDNTICPFVGPCLANEEVFRYYLGRVILRLGWVF